MSSYTRCDWCNGPIDGNKSTIVLSRQNLHHTCALQLGQEISEAVGEYEKELMLENVQMRYIRLRCPYCDRYSPVIDQCADPRRTALGKWWAEHQRHHIKSPIHETVDERLALVILDHQRSGGSKE